MARRIGFPLVSGGLPDAWPRPTTINPGRHSTGRAAADRVARAHGRVVISSRPGTSAEGVRVEIRARIAPTAPRPPTGEEIRGSS
jgi:hypothetical protein